MKKLMALVAALGISMAMVGCGAQRPGPQEDPNAPPGSTDPGGTMPRMPAVAPGGETKPAEGDAKPAEGDAKPAEGDVKPAEGDVKPAEGDVKPAESGEKKE